MDVRLRLRPSRRCAVERPLQVRLVDPKRLLAALSEVDDEVGPCVPPRRDRDLEAPLGRLDDCDAVAVGPAVSPPEPHERPADTYAAVAVEDRDDELRHLP